MSFALLPWSPRVPQCSKTMPTWQLEVPKWRHQAEVPNYRARETDAVLRFGIENALRVNIQKHKQASTHFSRGILNQAASIRQASKPSSRHNIAKPASQRPVSPQPSQGPTAGAKPWDIRRAPEGGSERDEINQLTILQKLHSSASLPCRQHLQIGAQQTLCFKPCFHTTAKSAKMGPALES